jgi:predicted peptidase
MMQSQALALHVTVGGKTVRIRYFVYLPEGYRSAAPSWPLLLFLHGAGERGGNLDLVKIHGPPKLAEEGRNLPLVLVAPQCPRGHYWSVAVLGALLDQVCDRYRVDLDRVYLTGLSMGGSGTWLLASSEPHRFAALAPICGRGDPRTVCRLRNVPVWAFHGAKDDVVPLEASEIMVRALRDCGGNAQLTVYPDAGHDSWTATYENPEFFPWLLAQRRFAGHSRSSLAAHSTQRLA